jgi:hypothetical protein
MGKAAGDIALSPSWGLSRSPPVLVLFAVLVLDNEISGDVTERVVF